MSPCGRPCALPGTAAWMCGCCCREYRTTSSPIWRPRATTVSCCVHHVKIYIYEPGLLHGKTVLSDGEAAFVGSVNMDYRSFQLHFECGTVLYGVPAIEGLAEDIQRITDCSHRVTYQEWKSRPWYRKLLSTLLRLFEMWM